MSEVYDNQFVMLDVEIYRKLRDEKARIRVARDIYKGYLTDNLHGGNEDSDKCRVEGVSVFKHLRRPGQVGGVCILRIV